MIMFTWIGIAAVAFLLMFLVIVLAIAFCSKTDPTPRWEKIGNGVERLRGVKIIHEPAEDACPENTQQIVEEMKED